MIFFQIMRRNALKLVGHSSATLDLARGRLLLLSAVFVLLYMMLAVRAFDLSVVQGNFWRAGDGDQNFAAAQGPQDARRGAIYDRSGNMLASSLDMASLFADPKHIADPETTAKQLAQVFPNINYGKTLRALQSKRRFVWLKRGVTPAQQERIMQIGEPGLGFRYEYKRVYPQQNGLAHLVGTVNVDGQGLSGIERSFDAMLSAGKDVSLTIDMRLQHILRREIATAMHDFDAIGGAGVIMNAKTGEILAGASMPDFNPHESAKKDDQKSRFNRLTLGVYELGSVFKIFSTAAFLENKNVPMSATFDARKPIKVGRFRINDYHAQKRIMTVPEVFMYSSNIGSAMMGQAVGGEALRAFYRDLGLLSTPSLEIAEIASPLVPSRWSEIATMTASYGHGIATTPLQVAAATASIINGGFSIEPTLIKHDAQAPKTREAVRIVSQETSYKMRELMRLTVLEGTGGKAGVKGYKVGGKTGTAEKSGSGGYDRKRLISSFVAAFPMDDPQYIVYIAIDEPKGNKKSYGYATAGWVAAPPVGRVISAMAGILGLTPSYDPIGYEHPLKQYVAEKS